ncbi:MAG: hypothetical protein MAG451_02428 [Anaerolineales bacterium]|nr:hypothetical protein [Anaerolineales bacterium]
MKQGIKRIALAIIIVLGVFGASALVVKANPEVPTEPIPPMDHPGPRVAFWLARMPKLVYVDEEEFGLKFSAFPMTGAVLVWNMDISTYMTLGSQFEESNSLGPAEQAQLRSILTNQGIALNGGDLASSLRQIWPTLSEAQRYELIAELKQFGFRYEPWASALGMLQDFWTETGLCDGMLALVSGPGGSRMVHHPCLAPRISMETLVEHGPTGWYEFTQGLTETLGIGSRYARSSFPVELFVVNRGPLLDVDRDRVPEMIDMALEHGIRVNVVPMGNEPGSRMRFPYLKPLRELAEATGGSMYYRPNIQHPYDYSMLPDMVPQMMRDFYGRMGQIDRGTTIAPGASLVLAPSEHVEIISPNSSQTVADTGSVRVNLRNLTIGEPQSVDLRLRVSTNITQTLLPVFRGSTKWVDPRHSYFEWVDQGGLPHRLPIPQRVISVTTGNVQPAAPTPTPLPTRTPQPTRTPAPAPKYHSQKTRTPRPMHTPWPTATPTASPTRRPPVTPTASADYLPRGHEFFIAFIAKNRTGPSLDPYPAPRSVSRVDIPVVDALLCRLFPEQ